MTLIQRHSQGTRFGRAIGAPLGIAALAATVVGCGARDGGAIAPQALAAQSAISQPAGSPVVVGCEPHQRTLVRPVIVNGQQLSQVECVAIGTPVAQTPLPAVAPAQYAAPVEYRAVRAAAPAPVYQDLPDAEVVRTERPATTARAIPARQVVYRDEVPVAKKRSVAKSAVIIGSSAGAGAGVGALVGGKKGALIGAAIGGGGATLWDQITRRKN